VVLTLLECRIFEGFRRGDDDDRRSLPLARAHEARIRGSVVSTDGDDVRVDAPAFAVGGSLNVKCGEADNPQDEPSKQLASGDRGGGFAATATGDKADVRSAVDRRVYQV